MVPGRPALSRAFSSIQHHQSLEGEPSCPLGPKLLGFNWQEGEQRLQLSEGEVCRRAGLQKGRQGRVDVHRVQPLKCRWLRMQGVCSSRLDMWIVTEPGLTNPQVSYLWQALNPCRRPCTTVATSSKKYLEIKYKTSAVCYRDQLPANLISSSMATAIRSMNAFYLAIFPPAGIHEKFCIGANIKNTRARLDHFTDNRGHTWDCNVSVTLQKH